MKRFQSPLALAMTIAVLASADAASPITNLEEALLAARAHNRTVFVYVVDSV